VPADQLDTRIEIITPENIAFQYCVAGPFRRLPAYLIDFLIRVLTFITLAFTLSFAFGMAGLGMTGLGLALMSLFVLEWFYGGLFETFWNGQTPGKRMMGIRVLSVEGRPINGWQAVLRNFLRAADALPVIAYPLSLPLFQFGLASSSMNDRFQRLGDLAAGTMVVVEEPRRQFGVIRVTEPVAIKLASELPASFEVTRSLGRALSIYMQRRLTFAWQKRIDIARHLAEPLRQRFGLPADTNPDLLLCALYYRTFITDRAEEARGASPATAAFVSEATVAVPVIST
jgi:uncharacterized RDD family membrane protein YckC